MVRRFLASSLLLALLGLAGCNPYKYYEGLERSRSDTAEIWSYATGDEVMNLIAINGDQNPFRRWPGALKRKANVLSVLPGKCQVKLTSRTHVVRIRGASGKTYTEDIVFVVTLDFEAKPGYSYVFTTAGRFGFFENPAGIACVYEDLLDDPKAHVGWTGEIRRPGENANKLACSPVTRG
jgi:hypothetical protein